MKEYFYTLLISVTPVLELRASIPIAILKYELSPLEALIISCIGGIIVAAISLALLPVIVHIAEKHIPFVESILNKIFAHTRKKHSEKMNLLGDIFLVIFVAIPLPGSGFFSGSIIAYLFGIKFWKALLLIGTGIIFSGIIVTFLTISGQSLWELLAKS